MTGGMGMQIMVLYGGDSAERQVSLSSGQRVVAALSRLGHRAWGYDYVGGALPIRWLREAMEVDAVFLAFHGGAGEDGRIQARLHSCGILHYTGSAPKAAAIAMTKDVAKELVARAGVPVPQGVLLHGRCAEPPLDFPFVIKPRMGGSSIGLHFIKNASDWRKLPPSGDFLCEKLLPGREFTVGILNCMALPVVEIRPNGGRYDYWHKYTVGASRELCPAPLPPAQSRELQRMALRAFGALGLRDYARIDFRESDDGVAHFLEANTLPGMTETSLFPLAAQTAGISFAELCEKMALLAAARKRKKR